MAEHIDVSGSISVPKRQHGYMFPCIRCTWPSTHRLLSRPRLPPSPTEHTPSRSSCSFIRPRTALHLRAVSMPYRHIPPLPAETPHGMPVPSRHKEKAAPSVTGLFPYDPSEATISGASARRSDQLTSSAAICPTAPGGSLTSGTGNCGGRQISSPLKNGSISRPTTFHPVRRTIPSDHKPLSLSAPYRYRISAIFRRRHPRTKRKTLCTSCRRSFRCWHLSIVPGRFQPSIVDTSELNCRVRDGNGCTLTVIDTNYLRLSPPISSRSSRGDTLRTE